jgi:hypothetical protein
VYDASAWGVWNAAEVEHFREVSSAMANRNTQMDDTAGLPVTELQAASQDKPS